MYQELDEWLKSAPKYQAPNIIGWRIQQTLMAKTSVPAHNYLDQLYLAFQTLFKKPLLATCALLIICGLSFQVYQNDQHNRQVNEFMVKSFALIDNPAYFYQQTELCSLN